MSDSRWYFTEEQLANSPSRKCGINSEQELSYRQRAANLIQEMGQRLQVSQLCINTGIVYMHRFYAFHSFTLFHRNGIAAAAFFLAAKVEEQPRKLEHVIKILNICLDKSDNTRESYTEQAQELVFNENVLLQTLGFDVAIDHPHTHVVRACQLFNIVTVSRELRQTCYFMASNSLHLTTMCLKYRPTVVAAFCIYIACKWSRWEIPDSSEGKAWYSYVDENVTVDKLKQLTDEYLQILERSPSKFKSKMKAITSNGQTALNTNPSVHGRDDVPLATSSHHKSQHEKHHHHHHSSRNSSGSTANNASRKQPAEMNTTTSSLPMKQLNVTQPPVSLYNKNPPMPQTGPSSSSSSSSSQRQRPSGGQQMPYSETNAKPNTNEDRTQHRQINQENSSFNMSNKQSDHHRQQRIGSTSQLSNSSQQQPHSQSKPMNHDQRHSQSQSSKQGIKQQTPSISTGSEIPNRSSSSSHQLQQQQQQQQAHKKPSWPPQQTSHSSNLQKPSQSHVQSSHSQPNLNSSNRASTSQTLPSYSESTKQSSSQQMQNDYWFNNDKLGETTTKVLSPIRPVKSMFSPSPEHDAFDRNKILMMTSSTKRTESPKSDKQDRQSSTPSKREKRSETSTTPTSQKSSQHDRKQANPKLDNTNVPPLISDTKKRPFSAVDDGDFNRDMKIRKVEPPKSDAAHLSGPMMKQPIETNPDIVKSLLKECYTTSKFDSFGMDSPLDVIGTDTVNTQPLIESLKSELNDSLMPKLELRDNEYDDEHHKKSKSKKSKKEKHHHKKKKSHKSDREDRKDPSLKIILGKDKSDSKSSPESVHTPGGLKIKIPIKDVNKTDLPPSLPPAPLKLKISKEKIGNFNSSGQALSDGGSNSSSSHKKKKDKDKDKDRSKSKSSKHGNNNNNSDFKEVSYQHQQIPVNKMNMQLQQQQQQQMHQLQQQNSQASRYANQEPASQVPFADLPSMFGANNYSQPGFFHHYQQQPIANPQQSQQEYHSFNDFFPPQ